MIKSFEKLKVRIDQNLNRAEKSEALAEDVVKVENKVACLKQVSLKTLQIVQALCMEQNISFTNISGARFPPGKSRN